MPAGTYQVRIGNITRSFTITSSFSVSPTSGPPGSSVRIEASGFNPNARVDIKLDGETLTTANADSRGKVQTTVEIPSNTSGGSKSIAISGPSGGDQAT